MRGFLNRVAASVDRQLSAAGTSNASLDDRFVADYESGDETNDSSGPMAVTGDNGAFYYTALNHGTAEIRTLTLAPASDRQAPVLCQLDHVSILGDAGRSPVYEALSYTWGDPKDQRVIRVNGCPFFVTKNLDVALRFLRKPYEPRLLWVDAICINQQNTSEKTQQVKMMKEIYRDASQVLVWLGHSDKDIRMAMDRIKQLENPGYLEPSAVAAFYAPCETGLNKIFRKTWWSRLWVVQEVLMAKTPPMIGCGRKWVSWIAFQKAMMNLALNKTDSDNFLENPAAMLNFCAMPTPYSTHKPQQREWWQKIENVLNATSDRDATEPHDKIFALLGLIDPGTAQRLVVDYSRPCSETYQTAMVCALESAPNLDYLIHAMRSKRLDVPSWCVDFSHPNWNKHPYGAGWAIFLKNDHSASGQLPKSTISHDLQTGTLDVVGSVLGRIKHAIPSKLDPVGPERFRSILKDAVAFTIAAAPLLEARLGKHISYELLANGSLFKTFMSPGDSLYSNPDSLTAFQKLVMPLQHTTLKLLAKSDKNIARSIIDEWAAQGRMFPSDWDAQQWAVSMLYYSGLRIDDEILIATDTGYLGTTPAPANFVREGDVLVILHGCGLPVVLRPRGQAYELVTWAFVSDVMRGEYFETPRRNAERLRLC